MEYKNAISVAKLMFLKIRTEVTWLAKSCHERIEREIESIEPDYYARIC